MTDVPPNYKNLQLESFGEQMYVTEEILKQNAANDEWLKQYCKRLEYLTPPAVRKYFQVGDGINLEESYGCMVSDETVQFNTANEKTIYVDFNNMDLIDIRKTTAEITSESTTNGVIKQCVIKKENTSTIDLTTRDYSPWTIRDNQGNIVSDDMTCNEFWYIGFDRNRHYETRPNWLKDEDNGEIPSISRAQTFKPKVNGYLKKVMLNINGTDITNTASPLIVEIRECELIDNVWTPKGTYEASLAREEIRFTNNQPGVLSVVFNHPTIVSTNKTYAIVLRSPLSHSTHTYWIGGWNRHCHADVYEDGNAFYSFNNGYTWERYGKDDEEVDYHQGKYAPQDFAFQVGIEQVSSTYIQDEDFYLYLTPILSSPATKVEINADDTIADADTEIEYQVSPDGVNWTTFPGSKVVSYDTPSVTTFIRARLSSSTNNTPIITNIKVTLSLTEPETMYVKTHTYYPKQSGILSASVWGRIFAPFEVDPSVDCTCEIIRNTEVTEQFTIIEADDLRRYTWIPGMNKTAIDASRNLHQYIVDNPSVLVLLEEYNVYVLDFFTEIHFKNSPSYPLRDANLQPRAAATLNKYYGEWYDYLFDYDNDTLSFRETALESLVPGTFTVKYNPVFIQGLTNEEVGEKLSVDGDNTDSTVDGLILDYFQEKFIVNDEHVETRRIPLRAAPLDPIRHVYHNDVELKQDRDYSIDFTTNELVFPVINTNEEDSILNINDKLEVVYTPNLDDDGLTIAWYASRTNTLKQARIKPFYIEYKA